MIPNIFSYFYSRSYGYEKKNELRSRNQALTTSFTNYFLNKFNVSNNPIHTLPPEIGELKSIVFLIFENTQLKSLPTEITKLKKLTYLDLRNLNMHESKEITKLKEMGCNILF